MRNRCHPFWVALRLQAEWCWSSGELEPKNKASEKGQRRDFMKKILFLVVVPVMMAVLIQCVSAPQRWPAYERRTEDRMFALQQRIGNGLASGELTPNEAQNLLAKLEGSSKNWRKLLWTLYQSKSR